MSLLNRVPISVQVAATQSLFGLPKVVRRLIAGRPIVLDGQELALDAQLLLTLQKLGGYDFVDGDPVQARATMAQTRLLVAGKPLETVRTSSVTIPDAGQARLYTPEGIADGGPLLLFFHGGGWVLGDLDSHDNLCRYLAKQGQLKVLAVDYRCAPEAPFPAAADDAFAAFRFAVAKAEDLGVDPERIAVGGDSAGGNLAAVTSYQAVRAGGPSPVFQLLFYPAVDATTRRRSRDLFADGFFLTSDHMDWFLDHYCPDFDRRADPTLSVLLAEDLSGMPPTYLATAGFDPLRDEGEAFADALREAGVPVVCSRQEDLIHGYATFLGVGTRFREAVAEAAGALRVGVSSSR